MSNAGLWIGSLLFGVAGGVLGSMLAAPSRSPGASADSTPASPSLDRSEFDQLERRLNELSAKVNAPSLAPAPAVRPPDPRHDDAESRPGGNAVSATPDGIRALERRIAALETKSTGADSVPADLSRLPVPELEALVRNLNAGKRGGEAITVAQELLRRSELTPKQRIEAEMNIGYALRGQGKHAEAEARFRESLLGVGDDSENAPWLGFQIAWERKFQNDLQGGIAEMEKAANHPRVEPVVQEHALYNAASFAREAGESPRAMAFLERFLAHADKLPPSQASMKAQAEAWLREIKGN